MSETDDGATPQEETVDSINQLVLAGEFGFLAVDGPFTAEKDGKIWGVVVPTDQDDHAAPNRFTVEALRDGDEKAAVLIADGQAVGGGLVEDVVEPEGHDEMHVVVNQYAMGEEDE